MYVELSFPSTNFGDYLKFRRENDKLTEQGILGANIPKPKPKGGKISIVDWDAQQIIWESEAPTPAGFILEDNEFRICDELGDRVVSVNSRQEIKDFFSHPYFNYPHDIDKQEDRFLVTSTGLDAILEFNRRGKLLFEWHAVNWGYDTTPTGTRREVDLTKDHRGIRYATLDRTAHINSAIYARDGQSILTTFFHKGELVQIDRETGEPKVLTGGLDHPHAIHRGIDETYIFSETGKNRVHVLDDQLQPLKSFDNDHDCEWIQDSTFTPDGSILIGDANQSRILEVSYPEFLLLEEFKYDKDWKLFKVGWDDVDSVERFLDNT